jgi:hypothetical protein
MTDPKADVVATAFTTARRQCRGLKGAVTRTHNEFVKIATYAFDNPNAHAEDQMTEALDSFKTARRKCDRAVQGMLDEQAFCYIPMTLHRSFWRDLYVTHSMMINTFSQTDLQIKHSITRARSVYIYSLSLRTF